MIGKWSKNLFLVSCYLIENLTNVDDYVDTAKDDGHEDDDDDGLPANSHHDDNTNDDDDKGEHNGGDGGGGGGDGADEWERRSHC